MGDEVFITGYDLSEQDDTGFWSTQDGTNWARVELPELSNYMMLRQIRVNEPTMVIAGDDNRSGFVAGRQSG